MIACTVGPVWQTCTIEQRAVLLEAEWAPFGPTCMKLSEIKLGIITHIISEYMVAVITVRNAFKLVTQLVSPKTKLILAVSHCKGE